MHGVFGKKERGRGHCVDFWTLASSLRVVLTLDVGEDNWTAF